jgi:hypothetical protein
VILLAGAPAVARASCTECLQAGAAVRPVRVPSGTPLAGYGALARRLLFPDLAGRHAHAFWFRPSEGELDTIAARALAIEANGARLVWVAADLIAVDRTLVQELRRRLLESGVPPATLIVSASHTHSGPGAFIDSTVMGAVAVDREDRAVRKALLDAMVETVRQAHGALRPVRVGAITARGPDVTEPRLEQPPDTDLVVLRISGIDGAPVAVIWNFAIHGTMLGPRNLRLSGDVMGLASSRLERALGVPALFVNGAVGDVSPRRHGVDAARIAGAELATAVRAAWSRIRPVEHAPLAVATARVDLPDPYLSLRNCAAGWVPRSLTVPLGRVFPRDALLTAVGLGDAAWVTIPGELQSRLGQAIKRASPARFTHPFVAGVSNDYLGYFLGPAEYDRATYIACASVYGPAAGARLAAAAADLLRALDHEPLGRRAAR